MAITTINKKMSNKLVFKPSELDKSNDILQDGEMYYLFSIEGYMVGQGNWEAWNNVFYDNTNDMTYKKGDYYFVMRKPTYEELYQLSL